MTAKEAKKLMKIYKNDYIKSQLKFINNYITDAVSNNLTNICIHGLFSNDIEIILRNLGYTVEKSKSSSNNLECLKISWEETKDV